MTRTPQVSLDALASPLRRAWSQWTCDPVDQIGWSQENPASGQCASTALVVQDFLGGELLVADVTNADGSRDGVHYWNRLADGREVDLTREQFRHGEMIGAARQVDRPTEVTRGRLPGNYHLLRARLARVAARHDRADLDRPVTVKAYALTRPGVCCCAATIETRTAVSSDRAPKALGPYSQAIVARGIIYGSGMAGIDPGSGAIPDGIEAQTEQALVNLAAVLAAAGASMDDVVKTTIFYADAADFGKLNEVYARHMPDPPPARSAPANVRLPRGLLVSIEAIALAR